MNSRGTSVPGGACGSGVPAVPESVPEYFFPLSLGPPLWGKDNLGLAHKMTASALGAIGEIGGAPVL